MTAPDGPADVPPRLAYTVGRFHTVLRAELARRLAAEGLTVPEFTALSVLSSRDGLSNAQLARRSFVTPQAMNQVLASLEDKQLITRRAPGSHPRGHHRARGARLTAEGRRRVALADTIIDALEDVAFARLDAAQRRELARALVIAGQNLLADATPGGPRPTAGEPSPAGASLDAERRDLSQAD